MYEYKVKVLKVVDGDTFDVDIDLGFKVWLRNERVRLHGIDTPESRTRDLEEKKYGLAAKNFLKTSLKNGTVVMKVHDRGKFGRILGEIFVKDNEGHPVFETNISVNQAMIENHHAVAYHGQSKEEVQEQHLENRKLLKL